LNTRAEFAADHPDLVRKVLSVYEKARAFALAHPDEVTRTIATYTKLPDDIAAAQLRRTSLETAAIGEVQKKTIEEAGMALQQAGIIPADVNVEAATEGLIDPTFVTELGIK
jgi:sulfonate transport system substrate-binding protein